MDSQGNELQVYTSLAAVRFDILLSLPTGKVLPIFTPVNKLKQGMENGNGKGLANVDISARIKQFVILNLIVLFGILISILL